MNPRSSFRIRLACAVVAGCAIFSLLTANGQAADPRPATQKNKARAATPAPRINEAYTAKIKEYTTEKHFLTELVDHLPLRQYPFSDK